MVTIDSLPELSWTAGSGEATFSGGMLSMVGVPRSDWIVEGAGGAGQDSATALPAELGDGS